MKAVIVTVVNNFDIFESCIKNNPNTENIEQFYFDNTKENLSITKRYNNFLQNQNDNAWYIFCHQDFKFLEPVDELIGKLDTNIIYGPIGVKRENEFIFHVRMDGLKIKKIKVGMFGKTHKIGQILEGVDKFKHTGKKIVKPEEVETLDCMCMIVHSSIITKYGLRFDENLDWHLYIEDFCINANHLHKVSVQAIQLNCNHLSPGNIDARFGESLEYLKTKYPGVTIASTCYDGHFEQVKNKF